jgi:hypothetical protein
VQLSLVAGAPQIIHPKSFSTLHARRPVVDLPESANMAPQTYEATLISGAGRIAGRISPRGDAAAFVRILATWLVVLFHHRNMLVRVRIIEHIPRALTAEPLTR